MMDCEVQEVKDLFIEKMLWFDSDNELDCGISLMCGDCTLNVYGRCGVETKDDSLKILSALMKVAPEALI